MWHYTEAKSKEKAKEEEEIGDLDQLLRMERLKEQKRKDEEETIEPEEDEAQVISLWNGLLPWYKRFWLHKAICYHGENNYSICFT